MSAPLRIAASGMCCAVGTSGPAARAAIDAGLSRFTQSRFVDGLGAPIMAASLPLGNVWGTRRIGLMLEAAVSECVEKSAELAVERTAVWLLVGDRSRPGHNKKWPAAAEAAAQLALKKTPAAYHHVAASRAGFAAALMAARKSLAEGATDYALIAAADSYLTPHTISHMLARERVLCSEARDGFIPGEGAAALLLTRGDATLGGWHVLGVGSATDPARIDNDEPLRADGLVAAMRKALMDSQCAMHDMDFRIADIAGESFYFREAGLALSRVFEKPRAEFPVVHITDAVGETGAAIGPMSLAYLASSRSFQGQRAILHLSNDDGQRAAVVLQSLTPNETGAGA